jgi:peptide/nickel transport system permease protein
MKHTIIEVFRSPKFLVGFSIFMFMLLVVIIYPCLLPVIPCKLLALGTFFEPGIYVNVYDSVNSKAIYPQV